MYILLKTDEPEKIEIKNNGNKAHFFYAENFKEAKMYLGEVEDTNNFAYWSKYYAYPYLKCCEEFNKYLRNSVLETNKLTKVQVENLCDEFLAYINYKESSYPNILIDNNLDITPLATSYGLGVYFKKEWQEMLYIVDKYTQTKNNIRNGYYEGHENEFDPIRDLGLILPLNVKLIRAYSNCGALSTYFYKFIYYFDFLGIYIPDRKLRAFWNFYKKTMDVYALQYQDRNNVIAVIPKPDEIFIENTVTHCIYNKLEHYCDGIRVPSWFYEANKDELKAEDFATIENADMRTVFIKKAGLEKFINMGKIIDTYENYPENEWWAKSEYKLIDMKKLLIEKITRRTNGKIIRTKNYKYAPFLCMKNQTTGEYHLEGVSPDCRNLYDALKMRYKMLNLPDYEIKDIK